VGECRRASSPLGDRAERRLGAEYKSVGRVADRQPDQPDMCAACDSIPRDAAGAVTSALMGVSGAALAGCTFSWRAGRAGRRRESPRAHRMAGAAGGLAAAESPEIPVTSGSAGGDRRAATSRPSGGCPAGLRVRPRHRAVPGSPPIACPPAPWGLPIASRLVPGHWLPPMAARHARLARRRPGSTASEPMHRPPGGAMADALRRAGLAGDRPAKS
jgi:hypothetical protein